MWLYFWDEVDCLALVLVYNLGVDLSCADIAMTEEFGDGVEVCSVGQCKGCEGVAAYVKGHMLGYAGFFNESTEPDTVPRPGELRCRPLADCSAAGRMRTAGRIFPFQTIRSVWLTAEQAA